MGNFFAVELPYIVIALFVLCIFLFIATREFMPKVFMRRGLPGLIVFLSLSIGFHYAVTENRVKEVKEAFASEGSVLCSDRRNKLGDRSIVIKKGAIWKLDGDFFVNLDGDKFSIRQCIVSDEPKMRKE